MRNCQICGHNGKRVIQNHYDGLTCCLFECTDCGHWYVDSKDWTQEYFDDYYLNKYRTDDKPYSDARLASLAGFVSARVSEVLDIGGLDGELQSRLQVRNVVCDAAGVGDVYPYHDCIVLSHTLEHVYKLDAFFERIACRVLIIEIPIHLDYHPDYDVHWQHVNKFRPMDVERLLTQKGYTVRISTQIEDYREYKVWRIMGEKAGANACR